MPLKYDFILKAGEGWMYLAIVMDLYSRCIAGWYIDKSMTADLVSNALIKVYSLRQPPVGLVFHSDRGSQYASKHYREWVASYDMRLSIGGCRCLLGNAVVERFFGSLRHDWVFWEFEARLGIQNCSAYTGGYGALVAKFSNFRVRFCLARTVGQVSPLQPRDVFE